MSGDLHSRQKPCCLLSECALAAFQLKPEILSISFPGSSLLGSPGTSFTAEHLHGKVTGKRRVGVSFCGRLRHKSDRSYKNIAYNEHKWIGSGEISSLIKIWACKNQDCNSVTTLFFQNWWALAVKWVIELKALCLSLMLCPAPYLQWQVKLPTCKAV